MYRVLIVDDHPFIHKFYGLALQDLPVQITFASDGLEGVRRAVEMRPHLILMDYRMPGLNGEQAALKIREDSSFSSCKIIALTAESRSKAVQLKGFDGFLLKPVRAEAVIECLRQHLNLANPPAAAGSAPKVVNGH